MNSIVLPDRHDCAKVSINKLEMDSVRARLVVGDEAKG